MNRIKKYLPVLFSFFAINLFSQSQPIQTKRDFDGGQLQIYMSPRQDTFLILLKYRNKSISDTVQYLIGSFDPFYLYKFYLNENKLVLIYTSFYEKFWVKVYEKSSSKWKFIANHPIPEHHKRGGLGRVKNLEILDTETVSVLMDDIKCIFKIDYKEKKITMLKN